MLKMHSLNNLPAQLSKLEEHYDFLHELFASSTDHDYYVLIESASDDEILTIKEIIENFLGGNINLSEDKIEQLADYATDLRKIRRSRSIGGARKAIKEADPDSLWLLMSSVVPEISRLLKNRLI